MNKSTCELTKSVNCWYKYLVLLNKYIDKIKIKKDVIVFVISSAVLKNSKINKNVNPEAPVANKNKKFLKVSFESNKNVFPWYFFSI